MRAPFALRVRRPRERIRAAGVLRRAVARRAPGEDRDSDAKKKKKDLQTPKPVRERKVKDDKIEVDGVVTEALPSANFRVEIGATKQVLLCTISGKIRKNFVKILVGDSVKVELSPYDLTRGASRSASGTGDQENCQSQQHDRAPRVYLRHGARSFATSPNGPRESEHISQNIVWPAP